GNYTLWVNASDTAGNQWNESKTLIGVDNTDPVIDAGVDIFTAAQINRTATVTEDGSGVVSYLWTKTSGTGTITFGTSSAITTTVSASAAEVYVVRLTVTDNAGNSDYNEFNLTWGAYAFHHPQEGYEFEGLYSSKTFHKREFTNMSIYDENLTMELFLNSSAGPEEERLDALDVENVYVYTSADGWTTLDNSEELFSDFDLYTPINSLSGAMSEIFMYFDFDGNAGLGKAIRHHT
ncbi:MAG: hypothetical protein NUV46_04855, partial [Nanoarchaeota archaeon]|nr:hypothetical protein [Nanoarchaeota archaeon]